MKTEIRPQPENVEKKKHEGIKSLLKPPDLKNIKKEMKSPVKTVCLVFYNLLYCLAWYGVIYTIVWCGVMLYGMLWYDLYSMM